MTDAINRFYNSIDGVLEKSQTALVELFAYFLTVEVGEEIITPKMVNECFEKCDLTPPAGTAVVLSRGVKSKPQKFIKTRGGYKLQRHMRETLSEQMGAEIVTVQTSATLRSLEPKMPDGGAKDFLRETIDCFEVGSDRATIVMAWILSIDHLFAYILQHKLTDFNSALAKDKGVKISAISCRDDFSEIKESKFIELCRAAKIVSNDVRKILDEKLGTRNSCAHPSGVVIRKTKVIDFVEDLVENVVLKYKI